VFSVIIDSKLGTLLSKLVPLYLCCKFYHI